MKKSGIRKTPFLFILLYLLSACFPEDKDDKSSINIFAAIEGSEIRVTSCSFQQNDSIGLFFVPYIMNNTVPDELGVSDYANNLLHIFQGNSRLIHNGTLFPWPGIKYIDIYGYYPYEAEIPEPRNYLFKVSQNQNLPQEYIKSDFLYANNRGLAPSLSVPLVFSHKMSKININLKSDIKQVKESMKRTGVSIMNVFTECIIDLANGESTVVSVNRPGEINVLTLENPVTGFDLSLTAVIPAQSITALKEFLRITSRGIDYYYTPEEEITLQQGCTTLYNIEITTQGLQVSTHTVNGWSE